MKTTFKEEPLYINTADRIKSINLVLGSQLRTEDIETMLKEYYSYQLLKLLNESLEKSYEDVAYHFFASSKYIVDSLQHDYSFVQQTCKRLERLEEWIDKLFETLLKLIKNTKTKLELLLKVLLVLVVQLVYSLFVRLKDHHQMLSLCKFAKI